MTIQWIWHRPPWLRGRRPAAVLHKLVNGQRVPTYHEALRQPGLWG